MQLRIASSFALEVSIVVDLGHTQDVLNVRDSQLIGNLVRDNPVRDTLVRDTLVRDNLVRDGLITRATQVKLRLMVHIDFMGKDFRVDYCPAKQARKLPITLFTMQLKNFVDFIFFS